MEFHANHKISICFFPGLGEGHRSHGGHVRSPNGTFIPAYHSLHKRWCAALFLWLLPCTLQPHARHSEATPLACALLPFDRWMAQKAWMENRKITSNSSVMFHYWDWRQRNFKTWEVEYQSAASARSAPQRTPSHGYLPISNHPVDLDHPLVSPRKNSWQRKTWCVQLDTLRWPSGRGQLSLISALQPCCL